MNGISVIICCYNSASRIGETLRHLSIQKTMPSLSWEILIVDNASTDNTEGDALNYWSKISSEIRLSVIKEPKPGLSYARSTGIESSIYDIIVFCDDDNHLEENYVQLAFQLMNDYPEVGIAGGWCKPKLFFYPGKWIEDFYSVLAIDKAPKKMGLVNWVYGAGMIVKKTVLHQINLKGLKLMLTGRLGNRQVSGDDAELCIIARFLGFKVIYSDRLVLYHKVEAHRLKKRNFIKSYSYNFYSDTFLFILERLIWSNRMESMYSELLKTRIRYTIHFFPRCFLGTHRLYSVVSFYNNMMYIGWLLINHKLFNKTLGTIKNNLQLTQH